MITIHEKTAQEFNHLGLGALLPGSCVVTEEVNGMFELQLTHSRDESGKWKRIERGRILYASTPKGKQPFRIYNIRPTMDGITVNARHIFYDLLDNQCEPVTFTGAAVDALSALTGAFAFDMPFSFDTDIALSGTLKTGRMNPIQAILTSDEDMSGFVQTYGGELERNDFRVSIKAAIGQDRDVAIRYGKNLVGLEVNEDDSDVKTRIVCYGKNGSVEAVDSPYIGQYPYPKIHTLENTDKTIAELRTEAEALLDSGIDLPLVNIKVDFVELTKTAEYADYAPLEKVELGDIVMVVNQKMNFSKRARVISYEWDCLLERYKEVVLGDFMPTLATSVTSGVHSGTLAGNAAGSAAAAMAALNAHVNDFDNPHKTAAEGLPPVTAADDGKVLTASGGEWVAQEPQGGSGGIVSEADPTVPEWAKQATKPTYTAGEVGADAAGTANALVTSHNTDTEAHNDLRLVIATLTQKVNDLLDSDDTTLDQMSEIVAYIKANRGLIESVTTTKVNVSDIIDNLTTNVADKPLSAAQGVKLKALIDAISIPTKVSELENDKNYLTEHQSLAGYATEAWVEGRGYLTEHQDLNEYSKTTDMLKFVYPVGAIYISTVATNPQTLFGFGTWEQIKDRFLLSAGDTYGAGATGGRANHNHEYGLKVYEYYKATGFNPTGTMTGAINVDDGSVGEWTGGSTMAGTETMNKGVEASAATTSVNPYHYESRAKTSTEDNMPPYLTVYMWKRTA